MYNFKQLEDILKTFPLLRAKAIVEAEELKYLFPSCTANYSGEPHGSEISDSTSRFGIKRESMSDSMKKVRVIEIALAALTEQENNLIDYMYFRQWRLYQIGLRLGLHRMQIWRVRKVAMDKIAEIIL